MRLLERLIGRFHQLKPSRQRAAPPSQRVPWTTDPTDSPIPQPPLQKSPPDDRVYRVKQGDTPESIAREVYGDAAFWPRIARANRQRIGDPPVLYPGQRLDLPEGR